MQLFIIQRENTVLNLGLPGSFSSWISLSHFPTVNNMFTLPSWACAIPDPGAFPARGRLRQAGASGVAGGAWSPGGAAGRSPLSISICHSFSCLGTKGPNFLLQMCSSRSNRGGLEENLLSASRLFLKQLRAILWKKNVIKKIKKQKNKKKQKN